MACMPTARAAAMFSGVVDEEDVFGWGVEAFGGVG